MKSGSTPGPRSMIFYGNADGDAEYPEEALVRFIAALYGKDFCISCGILHDTYDGGPMFCCTCGEHLAE